MFGTSYFVMAFEIEKDTCQITTNSQCPDLSITFSRVFYLFFRLTDTSDEDKAKQPMTETEMLQIPKYVAENWLADQSQD